MEEFTVLIVEDEPELALSLRDILESEGYKARVAHDGNAATALCRRFRFHLGVIDLRLPDMPGLEVVERLAALRPEMEYIINTGYASLETAARAVSQKRIIAYETKPVDPQRLIQLIAQVAERWRAEQALRESETRFKELADLLPESVIEMDREGRLRFANRCTLDAFGLTEADVEAGITYSEMLIPEDRDRAEHALRRTLEGGNGGIQQFTARRRDGSTFPVLMHCAPIMNRNAPVGLRGVIVDVTGPKHIENEIVKRNLELAALNAIAQAASEWRDLKDFLRNALDTTLEILGLVHGAIYVLDEQEETLALQVRRGVSGEAAHNLSLVEANKGLMGQVLRSAEVCLVDSMETAADLVGRRGTAMAASERGRSAAFVPLVARGRTLGVMAVMTQGERVLGEDDKSLLGTIGHGVSTAIENAHLMEEVSRARARDEFDRLRSALWASVSHEVRTPLTAIKGMASSLTATDVEWDEDTKRDFLQSIDHQADRLLRIVRDILDVSRIEAGEMLLERETSSLPALIERNRDAYRTLVGNHELRISVPDDLAPVYIDDSRIEQVIANLLENAAVYSPEKTAIELKAIVSEGDILVSVTDQGCGIPAEHLDRVFDRFYRVDEAVKRRRGGTGLGLTITKAIVEGHGGRIWAESIENQGSTFTFTLPIANE